MRINSFNVNRARLTLIDTVEIKLEKRTFEREYFHYFNQAGLVFCDLCEQNDDWTAYLVTVVNGREYNQWHNFYVKPSRQTIAIRCNMFLKAIIQQSLLR